MAQLSSNLAVFALRERPNTTTEHSQRARFQPLPLALGRQTGALLGLLTPAACLCLASSPLVQ